jgi:hypothetical protein
MPTPLNVRLFFTKRGIPVLHVRQSADGFLVEVAAKGKEAMEFWGASAEPGDMTISEVPNRRRRVWEKGLSFVSDTIRKIV